MKRWPTPGRIILGVLLLSAAVAALTLWPHSCLFQIPSENMVGFDEAQGLFYTTQVVDSCQKINTYDLTTGLKRSSVSIPLPTERSGRPSFWPCRISGDKRFVIAASMIQTQVLVYQLPSQTPVRLDHSADTNRLLWDLGVSLDGGALVLRSYGDQCDLIEVLDLDKASTQTVRIPFPTPHGLSGPTLNSMPSENMHMTSDRRYLATGLIGGTNVLYDLVEKKEVLRTKESKDVARFTSDGQTLVFLPGNYLGAQLGIPSGDQDSPEAVWYRLENGHWSLLAKRKIELEENEYILQACNDYYVTAKIEGTERSWLKRLPEWSREKLAMMLPAERVHFRFWNLASGRLVPELGVAIPLLGGDGQFYGYHFNLREKLMVSADSRYVAAKPYYDVAVWETSPRRSLACWLTALCLALLAGWFVWPRRVKQPQHS
ncbi:MAG: hypothetical protein QM703_24905 [Gemmatales bacterium]